MFSPSRCLYALALPVVAAGLLAGFLTTSAAGQDLDGIAAVVNEHAISILELNDRINISLAASGLQSTPEMRRQLIRPVLRTLIEEKLKVEEAKRQGIRVSDKEIGEALRNLERRNRVDEGGLEAYMASLNIPISALESQISAQLLWRKFLSRRLRPTLDISAEEVEDELARLQANRGRTEYLLSEIVLFVDNPTHTDEVTANADRLTKQIASGANFAALAQQFSQGSLANNGGDLGWITEGQMRPEIDSVLSKMLIGKVSEPIQTLGAVHILYLRDKRRILDNGGATEVHLKQILLPSEDDQSYARAEQIQTSVQGCDAMDAAAREIDPSAPSDIGWLKTSDLPGELREAIADLEIGQPSAPVESAVGIHVLMVCERKDPGGIEDQRKVVFARIERKRLEVIARGLLRDLQRNAFVDLRI